MKSYEIVWEIFNQCANNQMRDIFFEEAEIANPDQYVENKFKDKVMTYDKTVKADGTIIYDIVTSGIKQRISMTEF